MTNTYVNGKVHVRKTRCSTCVFGPNRPVSQARVDQMIAEADAEQAAIACHKHLYQGAEIEPVCRGYFDRGSSVSLRLAVAMDIVEFVS